jgi:hypothetical protein
VIKASATNGTTADNGKTWFFEEIKLKQSIAPDEYVPNGVAR